ncbi:GDSL-type esterase/lipase family protein [Morganella morganii]|uniref:tail fiber/spike domain-containing protein n=1 Tax=Morganella morganii TaxID=582 RepID=UPI003F254A80
MATIPTQNAVPSEAPRDLKFNSGKIDEFVTSLEHEYKDRFGRCHMTIEGMRWIFDQLMERFKVDINQAIIAAGYITMDSFQLGAEITKRNEILRDETTGEYYRWDGDLPKSVPAGSTPESSGGVGFGAWVGVGDASLRNAINETTKKYATFVDAINSTINSIIGCVITGGRISIDDGGDGIYIRNGTGTAGDTDGGGYFVAQDGSRFELISTASISTFGGVPGGSYRTALDKLKAYVSTRDKVIRIHAKTKVSMDFSPEIPAGYWDGYTLDVSDNITINTASDEAVKSPLVKLARPVKFFFTGNSTSYLLRPSAGITKGEYTPLNPDATPPIPPLIKNANYTDNKTLFCDIHDKESMVQTAFTSGWGFLSGTWPMGVLADTPAAGLTDDSVSIVSPTGTLVCAAYSRVKPCSEYFVSMYAGDNAGGLPCVVVEAEYKRWIYYEDRFGLGNLIEGEIGGAFTEKRIAYAGSDSHASQWLKNSIASVRVDTLKAFTILVNGIERVTIRQTGRIIARVGFGAMGDNNEYMSVFYPYIIENRQYRSAKPINIAVVGDSITDASMGNGWAQFAQQALEGTHGIRVGRMQTIAINGYASGDIANIFNATALDDIDVVLFQIGVNDIQRQSGREALRDNVKQMMLTANSLGIPCVVSLPTQFYTRDQSVTLTGIAGYGQPSVNYELGALYRAILARTVAVRNAEAGQPLNALNTGSLDDLGPIVAEYLLTNQDPVVMDNIHPTTYGRILLGLSNARAIASHMFGRRNDPVINHWMHGAWGANNWSVTSLVRAAVTSYQDGKIALTGTIANIGAGITADGTTVCNLPLSISPLRKMSFSVTKLDAIGNPIGQGNIVIDTNGTIKIYGFSTGNVCLDGVMY